MKKDFRDVKKEYGLILRWINGGGNYVGHTWSYEFWLENVVDREKERYYITKLDGTIVNEEAYRFIRDKKVGGFRDKSSINCYDNYIELFKIMGITELKGLGGIMKDKGMSVTKLSNLTNIPRTTISSLYHRDYDLKDASLEKCLKIAGALEMSVEELHQKTYFEREKESAQSAEGE